MDLPAFSIRRPVTVLMACLVAILLGAIAFVRLPVDLMPEMVYPTISVRADYPGVAPEEMENLVARPLEEAFSAAPGVEEISSSSSAGQASIRVSFVHGTNLDEAANELRSRLDRRRAALPEDMEPPIMFKYDVAQFPILFLTAASADMDQKQLRHFVEKQILYRLERVPGVAQLAVRGGLRREIHVDLDLAKLRALGLSVAQVVQVVRAENLNRPVGPVHEGEFEVLLRTQGEYRTLEEIRSLVVTTRGGVPVYLRDLAEVEDSHEEVRQLVSVDGDPAVRLFVYKQSGANTVEVSDAVWREVARINQDYPNLRMSTTGDSAEFIRAAIGNVKTSALQGALLAVLILLVFLRSLSSTTIIGVAIPISVISTFTLMHFYGFTLNTISFGGLALGVGMLVDNAIVVLENIFRYIEEKGKTPWEAARAATSEIALAVMATTFSLVVIFVPVSFMSSISGRFLYQFGITAAAAVMVSLLVSFTLTPMMSARLFSERPAGETGAPRSRTGFYRWIDRFYMGALRWALGHRLLVSLIALGVIASSLPLYRAVRQEYIPSNVDEGEFEVSVTAPEGASLTAMNEAAPRLEQELRAIPGVQTVLGTAGSGGAWGSVNSARFFVGLVPHTERVFAWRRLLSLTPWRAFQGNRSQREIMQEVRRRLRAFPDLRVSVRNPQTFSIGGPNFDVDFALLGPDLEALYKYAEALRRKAPELGLQDADITLKVDKPEVRVEIDRDRAARLGVDTQHIAEGLRLMVGGDTRVSRYHDESINEVYDVQLRLDEADRSDPESLPSLFVPRQSGGLVRLDNVVRLVPTNAPSRIDRLDRLRQVSLRAAVAPGFAQADRIAAVRAEVERMNLPPEYSSRVSGRAREMETTFNEFLWAFLLSVILMYIILASQFESLAHAFTILLSLPVSVPFALVSLLAAQQTLNLYSALGMLVLFGVVKKNAILQIDHTNGLRALGLERGAAILQANRDRLRPILMTTLTLIAGMLPLALGTGPGAEERRATAIVVIGGQSLCLLLTLIVTPVAYSLVDDLGRRITWRRWHLEPTPRPAQV